LEPFWWYYLVAQLGHITTLTVSEAALGILLSDMFLFKDLAEEECEYEFTYMKKSILVQHKMVINISLTNC